MQSLRIISAASTRQICQKLTRSNVSIKPLWSAVSLTRQMASISEKTTPPPSLASTTTALKQTLDSEIEYEKQNVDEDKEFPKAVTEYLSRNKLSLVEKDGDAVVCLTGQKDGLKLNVLFDIRQIYVDENRFDEEDDEEEASSEPEMDEEDADLPVSLRVELIKPNAKLTLEVLLSTEYVSVNSLHFTPPSAQPNVSTDTFLSPPAASSPFTGPNYMDLSEDLQESVSNYLTSLGLNSDMFTLIRNYMDYKEKKEYSRWLQNVRSFI